jgi:hypothetical protein
MNQHKRNITTSITITTAGYGMAAVRFIRSTLPRRALIC